MIAPVRPRRGGPLVALGLVLGCWVAVRVAMTSLGGPLAHAGMPETQIERLVDHLETVPRRTPAVEFEAPGERTGSRSEPSPALRFAPPPASGFLPFEPALPAPAVAAPQERAALPVSMAAGHQVLWMAALSRMPLPTGFSFAAAAASPRAAPAPFFPAGATGARSGRWSADGWLLWRQGGSGRLAAGARPATYGASQAGAVLRYRLSPQNRHRPEAYLRLSSALGSPPDRDAAAGISARPVAALPLRAMVELRLSDQAGSSRLRPAAMIVSELQPVDLPHGTRAEFYGQAGYVGGRRATPFADGQARFDARVAQIGRAELRAGAGAWAGAQKGAARLDAGPSAVLGMPVGEGGSARLGLDWRMRVAGDARPGSGVALTLSAGF